MSYKGFWVSINSEYKSTLNNSNLLQAYILEYAIKVAIFQGACRKIKTIAK